jgi:TPR repeat protein
MGTNAFPRILRLLRSWRSPPEAALVALLNKLQIKRIHIATDSERHRRAIAACFALGSAAEPLVPAVAEALTHMDAPSRAFAAQWLGSLGSLGKAATPALIKMLQDTNDPVRCFAAQELAHICGERRDAVVVVLKACLRDTDKSVRRECTRALQLLGEVPPDSQTAGNESLREKAESGSAEAQVQLAQRLYAIRPRLSTNSVEAYKWAAIAASHDNQTAKYLARELEVFMSSREVADAKLAAQAFAEGRKRAGIE